MSPRRVAVIGGGWCGVAVAVHLLKADRDDLTVTVFERRPQIGRGVAYGTRDDAHLLNVGAGDMSLDPDQPDDFRRFAAERGYDGGPHALLPRRLYGAYVADRFLRAVSASRTPVRLEHAEVVDLVAGGPDDARWGLVTEDGRLLPADDVVLATGHGRPRVPAPLVPHLDDPRVVLDPYAEGATAFPAKARVLVVGTGLTAVDALLSLRRAGHVGIVVATSRGGRWPCPHLDGVAWTGAPWRLDPDEAPATADGLAAWVRGHVDEAAARHVPWQAVVGAVRRHVPALWGRLPDAERRRFLEVHRSSWEVARHRVPRAAFDALHRWRGEGWLTTLRGEVRSVFATPTGLTVALGASGHEEVLFVEHVVLCTGAESDPSRWDHPLWTGLLGDGHVARDPLGLGVPTDEHGGVVGADGPTPGLWALGGLRRTALFESTAVPDLVGQAVALARRLADGAQNIASTSTLTTCSALPKSDPKSACQLA